MKIRYSPSDLALRYLPAALLAGLVAVGSVPDRVFAQSATATDGDTSATGPGDGNLRTTDDRQQAAGDDASEPDGAIVTDPDSEEPTDASLDAAALKELRRQNERAETIDGLRPRLPPSDELTPGIPLGTFTFRPTISQGIGVESTKTGKDTRNRTYLQTGLQGSIVSDWSLHQLRIDGEGTWAKTLSGIPDDDPQGNINAELRLDLSNDTIATFKAGYSLQQEDNSDPNAITNAENQPDVSTYSAGTEVTHDLGLIRGTAGIDFSRETYGDAQLANGTFISQADRNENTTIVRGRIGYELSPALIPFLEASYGQSIYDNYRDTTGYIRNATLYSLKSGVEGDFGEKLRGELSTGYSVADFEDARLKSLSAWTIDGNATWSPQRGSDVLAGLKTEIEPSTTAGASGSVAYTASATLTQAIIDQLSGRLSTSFTWRDYSEQDVAQQTVFNAGAGLTWGVSRSIDLTTDLNWQRTRQQKVAGEDELTGMLGISLKR
jgi:hypothetical protein